MQVPFEVPPSGKTRKGGYSPYCSIMRCLSSISFTIYWSSSGVPPLDRKILPKAIAMIPPPGAVLTSFLERNPQSKTLLRTNGSNQEE